MVHFVVFLTALFVTMVLVAMFMRLAPRLGFVDLPDGRKIHRAAIPRIGGIGMVIGAVVSVLVWLDLSRSCEMFLYGVGVIAAFGLWDDRVDLDYRIKFAGQLLAIAVVVGLGGLAVERLPGFENSEIPWLVSYPLTVFFCSERPTPPIWRTGWTASPPVLAFSASPASRFWPISRKAMNWFSSVSRSSARRSAFSATTPTRPWCSWATPAASFSVSAWACWR